uniref:Uncharacterized protein n=1 Tax=Candidatus Kentrum sp. LPFa TaxID=2126335 RepID=A0A450WVG6_9GAMM|nr:MAG: hypothetical protein BECKLPF1236B_GA0070989_12355 [Candidatus Kentron sp. LPFa]
MLFISRSALQYGSSFNGSLLAQDYGSLLSGEASLAYSSSIRHSLDKRESSNKYFLAIKVPSMALDPVPAFAGMTYPCRDDGIVEFRFDFQFGVKMPDSCFCRSEAQPR